MTPRNRRRRARHLPSSGQPVDPQPVVAEPVAEEADAEDTAVPDETVAAGLGGDEPVEGDGVDDEGPPAEARATDDAEPVDEVDADHEEGDHEEGEPDDGEPTEPEPDDEGEPPEPVRDEAQPDAGEPDKAQPEAGGPDEAQPDDAGAVEDDLDQAEQREGEAPEQDEVDEAEPGQDEPDDEAAETDDEADETDDEADGVAAGEADDVEVLEVVEDVKDVEAETAPDERAVVDAGDSVVDAGAADDSPVDEPADAESTPGPVKDPRGAWRRLFLAGSPRATRANVLALVLAGTLGFAIIAQVRQTSIQGLENLREDELVRIFAGVDQDGDRLGDEIQGLESSLQLLQSQSTNDAEAQRAAQERLDALGILAGTAPARGPGIVLTIRDPDLEVTSPVILDAIQELRDAGAEAIQIGDQRVVASTWFSQTDSGISVSGTELRPPYIIRAIGDGSTLAGAMEIPGGVSATVRRAGGETDVQIRDELDVDALLTLTPPQYAQPVPTSTP
ncbi:MAG TPA: DUF881 domain-containing protein [Ornithinibacter sp.]|nr:DUF881 domain-containing protein [Ornithinibacter sp.]